MKTYSATPKDIEKKWILIDADGLVLGRLAAVVATRLRGKHKPTYTPHMDCGDHVVIINAEKVKLTGKKLTDKKYYRHTGYPGGIKATTPERIFASKHPERVVEKAEYARACEQVNRKIRLFFVGYLDCNILPPGLGEAGW